MSASAHVEVDLVGVWLCLAFKGLKRNHKFIDRVKRKRDKMAWGREKGGRPLKATLGEVKPAAFCSVINGQERKEAARASFALLLLKGSW